MSWISQSTADDKTPQAPEMHASKNAEAESVAAERIAALQAQAWEAFSSDLGNLLQTEIGKWVAYHGTRQVYTGDSQSVVYDECLRRGFAPQELFVELVYPAATEEPTVFLPPTPN